MGLEKNYSGHCRKEYFEKADLIHATSDSEYEDVRRLGLKQPVMIIPNGIDIPNIIQKKIQLIMKGFCYLSHAFIQRKE